MSSDTKNEGEKVEEPSFEALAEAGALEADVGARFDQQIANIDPHLQMELDPFIHRDLRPEMMFIREELRQAKWQTLAVLYKMPEAHQAMCIMNDHGKETGARRAGWTTFCSYFLVRRTALKKLLIQDFELEDCELRNIGLAYAPTDP